MFDMLRNVLTNLLAGPATRLYPQEVRPKFDRVRGHIDVDIDRCIFCGSCSRRCPAGALAVDRAAKTWTIDPYKCVVCGVCADVCPKKCVIVDPEYAPPQRHKTLRVRQQVSNA